MDKNDFVVLCSCCCLLVLLSLIAGIGSYAYYSNYYTASTPSTPSATTSTPASGVKGRFVKIEGMVNSPHHILNIAEVRVFAGDSTNIAKNKTVTMSSVFNDFQGGNLVDEVDTNFAHTKGTEDPWMLIDLGSDNQITKIVVTNRKDCCSGRSIGSVIRILDSSKNVVWSSNPFTGQNGVTSYLDSYQGNPQYVAYPPSNNLSDS